MSALRAADVHAAFDRLRREAVPIGPYLVPRSIADRIVEFFELPDPEVRVRASRMHTAYRAKRRHW